MVSHIVGGLLAALVLASYFISTGAFGLAALLAAAAFLSPLGIAAYLSRTGQLDHAHLLAAVQLSVLITIATSLSGGSSSFAIVWLVLVPLGAALSGNRRLLVAASILSIANLIGLHLATTTGVLPNAVSMPPLVALASHVGAALYAGVLVASIQHVHRTAARQLEASRAAYRLIAENTSDLVTRHDRHGRATFASQASEALLGIKSDVLVQRGFEAALRPADAVRCYDAIAQCLALRQVVSVEIEMAGGNGDEKSRWLELRCKPLPTMPGSGAPTGAIVVTRDVTARKQHDMAMKQARDAAESASRAKSAFIATISHELRTPLNAIIGFSEMLHRDLQNKSREPRQAEYCHIIKDSGEHLMGLVKDLLDVSKIEAGKLSICTEPFRVGDVVKCSVDTLVPAMSAKAIEIDVTVAEDVGEIVADRRACKQMLMNLLSNACKFTKEGGRIDLSVALDQDEVVLAVRDTGIGITADHVARLGEPFYQVDSSYTRALEGAGLGLTIVRGLVELHGGRLEIESELGKGSCFTIVLPLDAEASPVTDDAATDPVALVA
jgi:cell cycle sensor histidine kinase DivJ